MQTNMKTQMLLFVGSFLLSVTAGLAADLEGKWDATDGESTIEISTCGGSLCTKIIWMKTPRKDENNEDATLRDRELVGVTISDDLTPDGNNRWAGSVYSPKKGKTYNGFATLSGDELKMRGCITSVGILCQTARFTRAE